MKIKAILFALTLSAVSTFGQGLVTFQNSSISTPIRIDSLGRPASEGGTNYVNITGAGTYSFFFRYGSSLQFTSQTYLNELAGRITTTGTANIGLNDPGAPGGVPTQFQLFAYATSFGSFANAQQAQGGIWYQSTAITQTPSISPSPGTPLFGVTPGTSFQGFNFNINPIPEPSTIALGILGAGSLLVLRRKK
jgi:hypothetical protein